MNVFSYLLDVIRAELEELSNTDVLPAGLDLSTVSLEPPRQTEHGDAACNAAMVLAKQARRKPREIAEQLAARLEAHADFRSVEVAGPGFVNLRLTDDFWRERLAELLVTGPGYGAKTSAAAGPSTSNMFRPTRPGRFMWGTRGARWSAMLSPACSRIWASR